MTLQQIKDSLPKYILLTPRKDKWRKGDQWFQPNIHESEWVDILPKVIGEPVAIKYCARRPIPDEVLENQAFWVLYNKLTTVLNGDGYIFATKNSVAPKGKYDTEGLRIVPSGWFGQFDGYKFKRAFDAGQAIPAPETYIQNG